MGSHDQYFRELAENLIEKYGPLIKVEFLSHFDKFEINFVFENGTVFSGKHNGQIDISRLALGYYGTGPCYAQVFLESAGYHISMEEIEKLNPGAIIELKDSKPVISYPNDAEMQKKHDVENKTRKLFLAIYEGDFDTFKTLVEQEDVDLEGMHSYEFHEDTLSALCFAVSSGKNEFVEYLIEKGVNLNCEGASGGHATALWEAASVDNFEAARLLLEKGARLDIGHSPVEQAISLGRLSFLEKFLEVGVDVNDKDSEGNTLMHYIGDENDYIAILQCLLDNGVNINEPNGCGNTPLNHAIRYERNEIAKALIDKDAKLQVKNDFGSTPLHHAACNGDESILKILINEGSNINEQDNEGQTPLHNAVRHYEYGIAADLLELGADANIKDKKGKKPIQYADQKELKDLLKPYTKRIFEFWK